MTSSAWISLALGLGVLVLPHLRRRVVVQGDPLYITGTVVRVRT